MFNNGFDIEVYADRWEEEQKGLANMLEEVQCND